MKINKILKINGINKYFKVPKINFKMLLKYYYKIHKQY